MFYRESLEKMVNQDQKENLYVFYWISSTISYIRNKELSVYCKWLKFSSLLNCLLKVLVFSELMTGLKI